MTIRDKTSYIHEFRSTDARRLTTTIPTGELPHQRSNEPSLHDVNPTRPDDLAILRSETFIRTSGRSPRRHTRFGGARRDRTDDLMLAKHALSQLSYGPVFLQIRQKPICPALSPDEGRKADAGDGGPGKI